MTQGENLSLQVSTYSERTSERPQQRKQDGHHLFGRLHGRARKFKGIKADGVFGRDRYLAASDLATKPLQGVNRKANRREHKREVEECDNHDLRRMMLHPFTPR